MWCFPFCPFLWKKFSNLRENRLTKQQNCQVFLVNDSFDFQWNKSYNIAQSVCVCLWMWMSFQHNCCHNKGTMLNSRVKDIIYRSYHTFCVTSHCVTVIDYDLLGNCFAFIFASLNIIMMTSIFHSAYAFFACRRLLFRYAENFLNARSLWSIGWMIKASETNPKVLRTITTNIGEKLMYRKLLQGNHKIMHCRHLKKTPKIVNWNCEVQNCMKISTKICCYYEFRLNIFYACSSAANFIQTQTQIFTKYVKLLKIVQLSEPSRKMEKVELKISMSEIFFNNRNFSLVARETPARAVKNYNFKTIKRKWSC